MLKYVQESSKNSFIVATEAGILHEMQKAVPHKKLIPAPAKEDNTCACSECAFMKMNTLQKLYTCLRDETPEIFLEEDLMQKARQPILRMMELSN